MAAEQALLQVLDIAAGVGSRAASMLVLSSDSGGLPGLCGGCAAIRQTYLDIIGTCVAAMQEILETVWLPQLMSR
jgi:hypothetical protein